MTVMVFGGDEHAGATSPSIDFGETANVTDPAYGPFENDALKPQAPSLFSSFPVSGMVNVPPLTGGAATRERDRLLASVTRFTDVLTDPVIAFELDELETFFAARR